MKIYTGLEYSYKWKYIIKETIQKAKVHPLTTYYFIVKDPRYVEEAFLQYTDALFNIEIMTMHSFLRQQVTKPVLTNTQKIILLKQILENNPNSLFYHSLPIFTTIQQLLSTFDAFYYANIEQIDTSSLPPLSKQKLQDCFSLYQQFLQSIPSSYLYHIEEAFVPSIFEQVFYVMEDCLLQPKHMDLIEALDENNTVYIISNHTLNDSRLLQTTYQSYFSSYPTMDITSNITYSSFLTSQLFFDTAVPFKDSHPFHILKETNPIEEVKSVCFSIYQDIVEKHMSYRDFAIYYPNTQYLEILLETLTAFSMPFNDLSIDTLYPILQACLHLLQYTKDNTNENFISLLDTLVLKRCSSFTQVNYYKKAWQETKQISHSEYFDLQTDIITHYCLTLQQASTISAKTNILLQFLQEEVIYDDTIPILQSYFTSLLEYTNDITLLEYIDLLKTTAPTNKKTIEVPIDHIYISTYQQSFVSLLPIKKIYLLGMNETITTTTIKDEGIVLDYEKKALLVQPYIIDKLSLQQNQFLKILSNEASAVVLSYSMATTTNESLLPSSYLLHLQELFTIPTIDTKNFYNHPVMAHRLYAIGGQDARYQSLNATISFYIQQKNQPLPLQTLPQTTMSASQLETYNRCPYQYFCQYGLEIQPLDFVRLQPNEIGNIVHYILESCSSFFRHPREIQLDTIRNHIQEKTHQFMEEHIHIKRKLEQPKNHFFMDCIKEDMVNTILILMQQMTVSSFQVLTTEEKIEAIYHQIPMKGFIDRVDIFSNHLKIMDYKSSDKDLDLSLAMQGFNMQMLLYLDILTTNKQLEKGALLYFNTKKRILKSSLSILEPELSMNFFKQYRMNGYVVDTMVEEIDSTIDSTSMIIKARYIKKEDCYQGKILSKTALEKVLKEVGEYSSKLYQQILTGDISIRPKASNDPQIHNKVHPCHYCKYRSICNLDVFYNAPTNVYSIDLKTFLGGE